MIEWGMGSVLRCGRMGLVGGQLAMCAEMSGLKCEHPPRPTPFSHLLPLLV